MNGRVVMEVREDNLIGVFVQNLEPYDSIRILISTALALLEGRAEVTFGEDSPLTEEEEQESMDALFPKGEGVPVQTGGQRDN